MNYILLAERDNKYKILGSYDTFERAMSAYNNRRITAKLSGHILKISVVIYG